MQKDTRKRFAQGGTPPVRGVGSQPVPPGGHFRRETEFAADRVPGTFSAVLCGHESGSVSARSAPRFSPAPARAGNAAVGGREESAGS